MTFDLEKRTTDFAKRVIRMCNILSKNSVNSRLSGQAVGSAGSIGANYREANPVLSKRMENLIKEGVELRNILSAIINKSS